MWRSAAKCQTGHFSGDFLAKKNLRSPAYWSASDAYAGPSPNQSSSPEWNATSLESSVGEPVGDNGGNGGELVERFFCANESCRKLYYILEPAESLGFVKN